MGYGTVLLTSPEVLVHNRKPKVIPAAMGPMGVAACGSPFTALLVKDGSWLCPLRTKNPTRATTEP
eukprot:scaffold236706_cov18-Prasinocladus_malaysianus.AAC.1